MLVIKIHSPSCMKKEILIAFPYYKTCYFNLSTKLALIIAS